jgi:hypothetical protein
MARMLANHPDQFRQDLFGLFRMELLEVFWLYGQGRFDVFVH